MSQSKDDQPVGPAGSSDGAFLRCLDASMLAESGTDQIALDGTEVSVGRGADNVVRLDAFGVSRHHARLVQRAGSWQVEDLGSTNGTRVNDQRVERQALAEGDRLAFGRAVFTFHTAPAAIRTAVGSRQQTLVIRPGDTGQAAAAAVAAAPPPGPAEPGREQFYDTGTHPRHSSGRAESRRSSLGEWLFVLLLCAGAAAAALWLVDVL